MKICKGPECSKQVHSKGLCAGHYQQQYRGKPLMPLRQGKNHNAPDCAVADCTRKSQTRGICGAHNSMAWRFNLHTDDLVSILRRGKCDACGGTAKLSIDHDHSCCPEAGRSCGKCIRGLLCHNCNVALGMLANDPARIASLLVYAEAGHSFVPTKGRVAHWTWSR